MNGDKTMTTITETKVQDKFITLNGLRFHYRDWGDEGAPPLVLLHGFTSHARSWDTFASAMQDQFRVLALDQRGHGETEWASDYGAERMVEDVAAFVNALGLQTFVLLGLSMGGRNAYMYTAQHPERVERLVIVDIGPEVMTTGSARIRSGVLAKDAFDDPEEAYRAARATNPRPPEDEHRRRIENGLMQREDGKWTWRYDKTLRAPDRPLPRPDPEKVWAMLLNITCPTLLVRGAQSDVLSRETAERMVQVMPNSRLIEIDDCGHSVPLDRPTEFIAVVRPFLLEGIR